MELEEKPAQDPSQQDPQTAMRKKNGLFLLAAFVIVFGMVGLSFAAVPLYNLFCRVTGFGGTTQVADLLPDQVVDRTLTIRFNTDTSRELPWQFKPEVRAMQVKIGEPGFINFTAVNTGDDAVVGTAVYNVTPAKAGIYFNKIQCFCFNEQVLAPNQRQNFPVYFFVDPAFAEDPSMDDVGTITLSYTFYRAQSQELATAGERFSETQQQVTQQAGKVGAFAPKTLAPDRRYSAYPSSKSEDNNIVQ